LSPTLDALFNKLKQASETNEITNEQTYSEVIKHLIRTTAGKKLTHVGMAEEDSLADERLWMYITTIDEARDTAHKNITKIKYISAQKPINYQYIDY